MSRLLGQSKNFGGIGLGLLTVLLLVLPLRADIHPVPLDKNTDAAKCLECHASDDSREFGGTGPTGPHGSIYPHILERRAPHQFRCRSRRPESGVTNRLQPRFQYMHADVPQRGAQRQRHRLREWFGAAAIDARPPALAERAA